MKKQWLFWEDLALWVRGRFTLTEEEKRWILLLLFISWAGLLARHIYQLHEPADPRPPSQKNTAPAP